MKLLCPKCNIEINLEDTSEATDRALCRKCGAVYLISDFKNPPKLPEGMTFERLPDGFVITFAKSGIAGCALAFFTLIWGGGSMGGIYGSQIADNKFDLHKSLFGIPFFLGTLFLIGLTILVVFGDRMFRVQGNEGSLYTGLWGIGRTKRFRWDKVKEVTEQVDQGDNSENKYNVYLEGEERILIESFSGDDSYNLRQFLKAELLKRQT